MNTTNTIPEYAKELRARYGGRAYEANRIVEARISEALEKTGLTAEVRSYARFHVSVIHMTGTGDFTRVYIGGFGEKKMLSSKKNEAIDTARVVNELVEMAQHDYAVATHNRDTRMAYEKHREEIQALAESMGFPRYGRDKNGIKIEATANGEVEVSFSRSVSPDELRTFVDGLAAFSSLSSKHLA